MLKICFHTSASIEKPTKRLTDRSKYQQTDRPGHSFTSNKATLKPTTSLIHSLCHNKKQYLSVCLKKIA